MAEADVMPATRRAAGEGTVLVVADRAENRHVLRDALEESGCSVLLAADAPSALRQAAEERPDLVLMAASLAGLDGLEIARRLKADPATARLPIVVLTTRCDPEHLRAVFAAGAVDYCAPPIRPRDVLARLAPHLRRSREARRARNALDAFGHASLSLRAADGRILWQTPLARQLLQRHFGLRVPMQGPAHAPAPLCDWVRAAIAAGPGVSGARWTWEGAGRRLAGTLHPASSDEEWLVVLTEEEGAGRAADDAA